MNRISRIVAGTCAIACAAAAVPALAQYATEFTPAKVKHEGTTTHDIAGSGTVKVKVLVNADGSHKVISVLSSSNSGDNDAAKDIAATSTYTPARRGKTPVVSFYDFILKFNGKLVSHTPVVGSVGGGAAAAQIDGLIRAGKYKEAIAKANQQLAGDPNNQTVLELLGAAQYFDGDISGSATSFSKVHDREQDVRAAGRSRIGQRSGPDRTERSGQFARAGAEGNVALSAIRTRGSPLAPLSSRTSSTRMRWLRSKPSTLEWPTPISRKLTSIRNCCGPT